MPFLEEESTEEPFYFCTKKGKNNPCTEIKFQPPTELIPFLAKYKDQKRCDVLCRSGHPNYFVLTGLDDLYFWTDEKTHQTIMLCGEEHLESKECVSDHKISFRNFLRLIPLIYPSKYFDVYIEAGNSRSEGKKVQLPRIGIYSKPRTELSSITDMFEPCWNNQKQNPLCPNNMQFHAVDIRKQESKGLILYNYVFQDLVMVSYYPLKKEKSKYESWHEQLIAALRVCLEACQLLLYNVRWVTADELKKKNRAFQTLFSVLPKDKRYQFIYDDILESIREVRFSNQRDLESIEKIVKHLEAWLSKANQDQDDEVRREIQENKSLVLSAYTILRKYTSLPMELYILAQLGQVFSSSNRPSRVSNAIIFTGSSHVIALNLSLSKLKYKPIPNVARKISGEGKCFLIDLSQLKDLWQDP